MEPSKDFVAIKEMIKKDWSVINISNFDQWLQQLEEEEHIKPVKNQSLIMQLEGNSLIKPKQPAMKRRWFQMINNANLTPMEWEIEIAKRIACVVVSYQVGLPYKDLWDQYADQGKEVGTLWLAIAKMVGEAFPSSSK